MKSAFQSYDARSPDPKEARVAPNPLVRGRFPLLASLRGRTNGSAPTWIIPARYWFTFNSSMVPLSNFTLFFSELITEPCVPFDAGESVRSEIPITP